MPPPVSLPRIDFTDKERVASWVVQHIFSFGNFLISLIFFLFRIILRVSAGRVGQFRVRTIRESAIVFMEDDWNSFLSVHSARDSKTKTLLCVFARVSRYSARNFQTNNASLGLRLAVSF